MHKVFVALMLCAASSVAASASDNLWVGTWKLDTARSHFIGTTFTYSQSVDGMYHYSDRRKGTATSVRIDGQEYKTEGTSTSTWNAVGDDAWDTIHKTNGVVVDRVQRQLSPDGTTFMMKIEGPQPDGTTFHDSVVYKRLTPGNGLLGKWISTRIDTAPETIVILPSPSGVYRWEAQAYKVKIEGRLDGSDIPVTGPQVSPGSIVTFRQITSRRILHTFKLDGRVEMVGVQTLARDGKSFTDVSWIPGKKSEKSTGLYVKQ